jgi:hypothetical protein
MEIVESGLDVKAGTGVYDVIKGEGILGVEEIEVGVEGEEGVEFVVVVARPF